MPRLVGQMRHRKVVPAFTRAGVYSVQRYQPFASDSIAEDEPQPNSRLVDNVVGPAVERASTAFLRELDLVTVEDLCRDSESKTVFGHAPAGVDFAI